MKTAFAWHPVRFFLLAALAFCSIQSRAQVLNSCGTRAIIAPGVTDTVVQVGGAFQLSSVSLNATQYHWLLNGVFSGVTNGNMNYWIGRAGTYTFNLVAINGNCRDTATLVVFCPGTPRNKDSILITSFGQSTENEYSSGIAHTPDGGSIISAHGYLPNCGTKGLLIKLNAGGCIEWTKSVRRSYYCDYSEFTSVYSSPDSSIYALSKSSEIVKLDQSGNLAWVKRWGLTFEQLCFDPEGNFYGVARANDAGWVLVKFNPQGDLLWNRFFRQGYQGPSPLPVDFSYPFGIAYQHGRLYVTGMNFINSGPSQRYSFLACLDAATGQPHWQYGLSDEVYGLNQSQMLLDKPATYNGGALVPGYNTGLWATLVDSTGVVRKTIKAQFGTSYGPRVTRAAMDSAGNIFMMQFSEQPPVQYPLQTRYLSITNFVKIDTALNKLWGMSYDGPYNNADFRDATLNKKGVFTAVGSDFGFVDDAIWGSRDIRVLKVDPATMTFTPDCNYGNLTYTLSTPFLKRVAFNWIDSTLSLSPLETFPVSVGNAFVKSRYSCPDFVDSCSILKLSGPTDLCNTQQTYTYRVHRNRKCALSPTWNLPSNVSIVQQTDTSISLRFNGTGTFRISAFLRGCIPTADSLLITLMPKTPPPFIGRDTILCTGTSIRFTAGPRFRTYEWVNGSTDSVLTITQPGLFWVRVVDSCGNVYRDSITVSPYHNEGLSAGPDRIKCNNDTLHLAATPGFSSYTWSNNYNINTLTSRSVIVNPATDIAYYVRAEKIPGCFAYDTVRITVHHSPSIQLGADRHFCNGDSTLLDAGGGFQQYLWSSGQVTSTIFTKTPGEYRVLGTTSEGCKSFDTLVVLPPYPLPRPLLDKSNALCFGATRVLNPGSFAAYQWSTGATTPTLTVTGVGRYGVLVTDANGCQGADSTTISVIHPLPAGFLPADTAICSYGTLELKTSASFNRYGWSTGATSPAITIAAPGVYWLRATDRNNCNGSDSILVNLKECLRGLFVPTAFTPNGDGKNDQLKGMLFGNIKAYDFRIYNRWGQVVFRTTNPARGWDGKVGGMNPESTVFVWTCLYQLEGEPTKTEKGSVVLIR